MGSASGSAFRDALPASFFAPFRSVGTTNGEDLSKPGADFQFPSMSRSANPTPVCGPLTRVLREAVSNVIRHSAAAVCTVRLQWTGERMKLSVQDNGKGLDPAAGSSPVGHGLPNIERRVRHLGGSFRLVTAPDGGALLEVEVPVQEPSATIAPS